MTAVTARLYLIQVYADNQWVTCGQAWTDHAAADWREALEAGGLAARIATVDLPASTARPAPPTGHDPDAATRQGGRLIAMLRPTSAEADPAARPGFRKAPGHGFPPPE